MEIRKIYPSQQLVCALEPRVLNVFMWLCGWQSKVDIKLYVHQMSKYLHLSEEEVELSIQTLKDINLISIRKEGKDFIANLNADQVNKYFNIQLSKIAEGKGIPMASAVTWNKVDSNTKSNANTIDDMSKEQMKRMLLMLQAQLKEEEEVEKIVVSSTVNNDDVDSLPF